MYSLTVRDHVMIAHSFRGAVFGPAQRLHGATYVVDATVRAPALDADGLLVDIGLFTRWLGEALDPWRYRNLDEVEGLAGENTTTEVLAGRLHAVLAGRLRAAQAEGTIARLPAILAVSLHESHVAWASYEAAV